MDGARKKGATWSCVERLSLQIGVRCTCELSPGKLSLGARAQSVVVAVLRIVTRDVDYAPHRAFFSEPLHS